MTAKMISTGKNDPRITNLLDKESVFAGSYLIESHASD